ncbi:MATE family efflux transporter [Paenibacillus cremeus]|uniref:MATE family efflux transporter n=1 Tax=Paenibacillus cremeus TaxID=2163881 RepID=A0A559KG18_9BACL|nr:MATE family efflux transporter [Paenibacillus cremeus]TVY11073.1 MATE family efflux transporter [Paenibacillus cremeus]
MSTEESVLPLWKKLSLIAVTWPIFIDIVLRMLLGTADVFMLSRISDQVTGAVGLANEIIAFCIMMFGFVGLGTSVVVTQYLGAGRAQEASRISALAVTINGMLGLVMSLILYVFGEPIMRLLNLPSEQVVIATKYLSLIGAFIWVEALSNAISSVIRSNGYTRDVMYVTLGVNLIHVVGNFLLIFGHLGFPELGVTGAAISTIVSRLLGLAVLFVFLNRRISVPIQWRDYVSLDGQSVKQILNIGLPSAGEHLSWQSHHMMIVSFINLLGQAALSTHIYVMNISNYFMALGVAIGAGTEIIIGHMVGAGEHKIAYRKLLKSLRFCFLLTFGVVGIASLFRKDLLGLFTSNPEIIGIGSSILLLSIILEPGRTFNLVVINSLRAAGDAKFPVLMGVWSMWGVAVPLAYWLGIRMDMGLLGVWIAFTADEWIRGLLMLFRWKSRAWERKSLVKPHAATAVDAS